MEFIFEIVFLFYACFVMFSYTCLGIISTISLRKYIKKNHFINYNYLVSNPYPPKISLIAPAFNEQQNIQENVTSLLQLNYTNYEVIVVNDGSKDNSLDLLIEQFQLVPTIQEIDFEIETKQVFTVFKSYNPAFSKLIVVDKENGGKADALNVGIQLSDAPYFVCVDVDCIMDKDSLNKMLKPFLEEQEKKVIASGGVVRIANDCVIKYGKITSVSTPKSFLARSQVIEYLRAFLLGRMAWASLDGLLIISGAFGMFDRKIALKVGGYNHKTVGEDMELVVRMRRYMIEQNLPYLVDFIPDPLCWTEVPESKQILLRQRSRWTRGTMETLWIHRKMLFNPNYGILGLLSFPYWLFFEYLAPIIEAIGIILTIVLLILGKVSITQVLILYALVYVFAIGFNIAALVADEFSYRQYKTSKDGRKLFLTAILDPILFHPITVYASLKGNYQKIKGQSAWGEMTRKGFKKK